MSHHFAITTTALFLLMIPARAADPLPLAVEKIPNLFVHRDTCNVYVLRDGDKAMLINLGDGSVLDVLKKQGIKQVEWILFTDHHREVCQGVNLVDRQTTKIAAPKLEQELFENPLQFRKWRPALSDKYTVHGASYVRPSATPIKLDRLIDSGEEFTWRDFKLTCLSTPGTSPGGMSYIFKHGDTVAAFTGGIIHDTARMTNWYDIEWDYGFGKGLDTLVESVQKLRELKLVYAFPSSGPVIHKANEQLESYHAKLTEFRPDYLRGYPVNSLTKREKPHPILKPTAIPEIVQVTPHLYKFSDKLAGKNFAIIISDNGRGLLLDCGLFTEEVLHDLYTQMQKHLGLKRIDALWINHMHGDHFTLGATLKKKYGTQIWTLKSIADKVKNPLRYDYCALITSYNPKFEGLEVDVPLKDGEVVEWEGLKLNIDWMPGQTEFGNCLWLQLDGKKIAFTGDNLFGDPSDPKQNGHEAVVARNSAIFEEGYILGSKYLVNLKPDIIMGAHNVLMTEPTAFVERYHEWSKRIVTRYKNLLPDPNYEYQFDPFWVSAYPYRVDLQERPTQQVMITVRNFRDKPQRHEIRLRLPPGVTAEPAVLEGTVAAKSRQQFPVTLKDEPSKAAAGVQIIPFDITLDDKRYGELFDFIVQVKPSPSEPTTPRK